jgi:hypothetical protein
VQRRKISGSLQFKIESLGALINGVTVDRDEPDQFNGITWRLTFLDLFYSGSLDVAIANNNITTKNGNPANLTITKIVDESVYSDCTGTHIVSSDKALTVGQLYFARVFATNEVGFSMAGSAAAAQKPMVTPGGPTAVALSVASSTSLMVSFNPPSSDGGDTITAYRVEFSTSSDFSDSSYALLNYFAGGAPYHKTITDLTAGQSYYIRVQAMNSQGYGTASSSTPSSAHPYGLSGQPSNVEVKVTSDSMLTVKFSSPKDIGGDSIISYRVEWDVNAKFNSVASAPNKGYADVDASRHSSYTIRYLTAGQTYYVRVFPRNLAGLGESALAYPGAVAPSTMIPGRPHTIQASTGTATGEIKLSWQFPKVPWHDIPCSGLTTSPYECPTAIGGDSPQSVGGSSITEYVISYNNEADFSGRDTAEVTTTSNSYVLTDLVPGRLYFVRILARNSQGSGYFCAYSDSNCLNGSTRVSAIAQE